MTKLFRKIRRNLLIKNKTGTYFKYAIGEIILVVIGILIALQINNWNEDRKLQKEEIRILNNLSVDLQQTLTELESALVFHQKTITEIGKIEHYIKNKIPYSEAIESSFGLLPHYYVALITSSSYKSLQSIGVGIIKNNKLKDLLINTYDVALADILDYNEDEFQLQTILVTPFFSKNFRYMDKSLYHAKPNNYDNLIDNEEFLNILSIVKRTRRKGIERYNDQIVFLKTTIEAIQNELEVRDTKTKLKY